MTIEKLLSEPIVFVYSETDDASATYEFNYEEVKQVIANMMFNMGLTRLSKFKKHNAALQCGDWPVAAVEGRDSRWYKQVTNRAERLMERLEAL